MNKKCTFLQGTIVLPLITGQRATISYNGQTISTSTVVAIHEIAENRVIIETRNTVYCVAAEYSDEVTSYVPMRIEACM